MNELDACLKLLQVHIRISFKYKYISMQNYSTWSDKLTEVCKMLGGWACLENKGTHKAVEQLQSYMRIFKRNYGDFWILKCDISKFFYNIDKNILFDILSKYIADKKLLDFTHLLIFDSTYNMNKKGIPIGNYTSQFFANIYMNELDQYVKHILKCKYYVVTWMTL